MRVLAVCHDAGGAEIVAAWLRRRVGDEVVAVAAGPAERVFARALPELTPVAPFPPLTGFDLVLCGSSGAAALERRAVRAARAAGVRCAVWLDHWVSYRERFVAGGELVLPDEVWVADEHAERLARETLPGADVRPMGNPYLEDAVAEVRASEGAHVGGRVLYVTEPTSVAAERATGDPLGFGYDERDALDRYLAHLAAERPAAVRVRPHPAESRDKYDGVLARHARRLPLEPGGAQPLAADIAWAATVAGCDTMAMVVALMAGRRVVSAIPPGGRPLSLPFRAIERPFAR